MIPLFPLILFAVLPLGALAAEAPHGVRPPSREQVAMRIMVRQLLLARYDANQDGKLDEEERRRLMEDAHKARQQQAQAFIRRFDTDADGRLSAQERAAMKQELEQRRHAGATPPPADGRGAAPPPPPPHAGKRGPRGSRHHGPRPHMGEQGRRVAFIAHQLTMDAYDADKDGKLDTQESARLREDGAKLYAAREAELLAQYDADKDGRLSTAELEAALHAQRPRPRHAQHTHDDAPRGRGRRAGHHPLRHLLGTHFDIDILLNLAHSQAEGAPPPPPCAPSTPTTN